MARYFTQSSSQYLENGNAAVTAVPLTMACWFNSIDIASAQSLITIGSSGTSDLVALRANGNVANDPVRLYTIVGGAGISVSTTTGYSASTWHHACAVMVAPDDWFVLIDGDNKGSSSATRNLANLDTTTIGSHMYSGARDYYMDGAIAEAAVWNAALSDAEAAVLAAGYSPLFVRPQNLIAYWPLIRDEDQDRVGGYDMTPAGEPTIATHVPKVIYPAMAHYPMAPSGVPATLSIDHSSANANYWIRGVRIRG
jgi:hypothetical protein